MATPEDLASSFADRLNRALAQERRRAEDLTDSSWWKNRLIRGRCHFCGGEFRATEIVMDFKVALAAGGKAERGNAVPACRTCRNRARTACGLGRGPSVCDAFGSGKCPDHSIRPWGDT